MKADYIEKGVGHRVILLHSSVATNKQWKKLIEILSKYYNVVAPNLYGYGKTDRWNSDIPQTLKDQAEIIHQFIPTDGRKFSLVGHSFGGSVAMMAAKLFRHQVNKLVLLEPNPNYLLRDMGKINEFNEISALRDCIKVNGADNKWEIAAKVFADYFNGDNVWDSMNTKRREKFINALKPNYHEWDAVMNEQTSIEDWNDHLPENTTVLYCKKTINSITGIIQLLRSNMVSWNFVEYQEGGHMAPLTIPDTINPMIAKALID